MDVNFGEDGSVQTVYISDPLSLAERIAIWLGI